MRMRKNLYELLAQRGFDVNREYLSLWKLFAVEKIYDDYTWRTFAEYIDTNFFREFAFRGSFTSILI